MPKCLTGEKPSALSIFTQSLTHSHIQLLTHSLTPTRSLTRHFQALKGCNLAILVILVSTWCKWCKPCVRRGIFL